MPEHVHLLVSEPARELLAVALQAFEDFGVEASENDAVLAGALL